MFTNVLQQMPDTKLLIVGNGSEDQSLKDLAQSLGIQEKTVFLGARRDILELLHALDVFALSSWSEGTSVSLLEATAVGLAIAASGRTYSWICRGLPNSSRNIIRDGRIASRRLNTQ